MVGSLLLGLYDSDGFLHHVGFTSTIPREDKKALTVKLKKLIAPPGFTGNSPDGPSRWSTGRLAQWQPIKPVLVVDVRYDHFTGHQTKFLRWRPQQNDEGGRRAIGRFESLFADVEADGQLADLEERAAVTAAPGQTSRQAT